MAAAVVAAIITQLSNTISVGNSVVNFFSFFTIQSNIIGAAAVTTAALGRRRRPRAACGSASSAAPRRCTWRSPG